MSEANKTLIRRAQRNCVLVLVFLASLVSAGWAQQSTPLLAPNTDAFNQTWSRYDNFDQTFLNPAKWLQVPPCREWSRELECIREIQFGKLRLAVRNYGDLNSNEDSQYGSSEISFINPSGISGIRSRVVIARSVARACEANPDAVADSQTMLTGTFFNNGTDDVWAFLIMAHPSYLEPNFIWAGILVQRGSGPSDYLDLGGFYAREPVIAQLEWDRPNHRFAGQLTRVKTGDVFRNYLPYTDSDTLPPGGPQKLLRVTAFSPNCVGDLTWANVDATFDDVAVK